MVKWWHKSNWSYVAQGGQTKTLKNNILLSYTEYEYHFHHHSSLFFVLMKATLHIAWSSHCNFIPDCNNLEMAYSIIFFLPKSPKGVSITQPCRDACWGKVSEIVSIEQSYHVFNFITFMPKVTSHISFITWVQILIL